MSIQWSYSSVDLARPAVDVKDDQLQIGGALPGVGGKVGYLLHQQFIGRD